MSEPTPIRTDDNGTRHPIHSTDNLTGGGV